VVVEYVVAFNELETVGGGFCVPKCTSYELAADALHASVGLAAMFVAPFAGDTNVGTPGPFGAPRKTTAPDPITRAMPHNDTPIVRNTLKFDNALLLPTRFPSAEQESAGLLC